MDKSEQHDRRYSGAMENRTGSEIAIIGMAGRFPGAQNLDEYWQNLCDGVTSLSTFTVQELIAAGVEETRAKDENYVRASPVLEGIDLFDASFFGYSPREAELIDPQQRLFLECSWEALENAGYDSQTETKPIGVYAGAGLNGYLYNIFTHPHIATSIGPMQLAVGTELPFLTARVCYKLDLKGPSCAIRTACSTGLVAVHMACRGLLNGECHMALAGAVYINTRQNMGYLYEKGNILSPDGYCRAFDARAQGTVFGSGVGVVVLKRLQDALAERDMILAVIKGSAVNNDGAVKVSFTAPAITGQAEVVARALTNAGVGAESLSYIECHGTGTALGDPIEIQALTQAFRAQTDKTGFCAIGSVKTNIGHLDAAAGIAGLIKTVLALQHGVLPPSLHFDSPNPAIDFEQTPFYVNHTLQPWRSEHGPRRAGVSAFGFGGTNAHVIVEEAPCPKLCGPSRPWHLLVLSAKTEAALAATTTQLAQHLQQHPELPLADVAYTLQVGRRAFDHRRMLVCQDRQEAVQALAGQDATRLLNDVATVQPRVVFLFSGQGAQQVGMAQGLYENEPTFRDELDRCAEGLQPHLGLDLRQVLYPPEEAREQAEQALNRTELAQPALFSLSYALAQLWEDWGIQPQAMLGHSVGEYVAACRAGVFSLQDGLALVAARGRLMQAQSEGAMLSVCLSEADLQAWLEDGLALAAVNAPQRCVVSGRVEAIEALAARLRQRQVACQRLVTSHAFHSPLMEPMLEPFRQCVQHVKLSPPQRPYLSNVTGTWITAEEATDVEYWVQHVRQTVRFAQAVQVLAQQPDTILLEVGPGQTLSSLARLGLDKAARWRTLASLPHVKDERPDAWFLLQTLGRLWLAGVRVDWLAFYRHERRRRVPLPTYPFERKRYWIESQAQTGIAPSPASGHKKPDIADWFYIPSWKRSLLPNFDTTQDLTTQPRTWLLFMDGCGLGDQIAERLKCANQDVVMVGIGAEYSRSDDHVYTIAPQERSHYEMLLKDRVDSTRPLVIIHLWNVTSDESNKDSSASLENGLAQSLYSLIFLLQALGKQSATQTIRIGVVSNHLQNIGGDEPVCPEKATLLGPCRVAFKEYPNIFCQSIDIVYPAARGLQQTRLVDQLLAELGSHASETVLAYRGDYRWVPDFEPIQLQPSSGRARLREQGVYLITGGLGGIGLTLAEHLARTVKARLALVGRTGLPPQNEWEQWLAARSETDKVRATIVRVKALQEAGAQVLICQADIASEPQMQAVIRQVKEQFGTIHGVIHAAGVAGGGVIQAKSFAQVDAVLTPKVRGSYVLVNVLKGLDLDFLVLCSSSAAYTGPFGQVDYCAANAFLDAFAQSRCDRVTCSINWAPWQDVGMSINTELPAELKKLRDQDLKARGMSPQEGVEAFCRILASNALPQVLVSTYDAKALMTQTSKGFDDLGDLEQELKTCIQLHSRPNLQNPYIPPRSETERRICALWQQVLGVDQVGIYDNFFDLGGNSLISIQLVSRINRELGADISAATLYEVLTVSDLSKLVDKDQKHEEQVQQERLAQIEERRQKMALRKQRHQTLRTVRKE